MKDPAIVFYTSDFLTGVSNLTMEERGQYITLLCLQHQLGHLSEKTIKLNIKNISKDVLKKFSLDDENCYYNERLEFEINKRSKFIEHQRENGKKGGRPSKKEKPNENPNETQNITQLQPKKKPLENEDEDVIIIDNKNNKDIFSYIEEQLGRMLSSAEIELIQTWEDNELTRYAIKQTALARATSLKYTQGILNSYEQKEIKTVAEAEREKLTFEKKKQSPKKSFKQEEFDRQMQMIEDHFNRKEEKNE